MIGRGLAAERVKLKRTWLLFLAVLGPVGVIAMEWVNFSLRFDYLVKPGADGWDVLIRNVHFLNCFALPFGATLLTTMIAGLEHQANSWKQWLALPVPRTGIYVSKWLWVCGLLLLASLLLIAGMVLLGLKLGFGPKIGWGQVIGEGMYPFLATLPIVSIQLWLSCIWKNQALPFSVGLVGSLFAPPLAGSSAGLWIPYTYPFFAVPTPSNPADPLLVALLGLGVGVIAMIVCALDFARRDSM
jgi:hypothetical protein